MLTKLYGDLRISKLDMSRFYLHFALLSLIPSISCHAPVTGGVVQFPTRTHPEYLRRANPTTSSLALVDVTTTITLTHQTGSVVLPYQGYEKVFIIENDISNVRRTAITAPHDLCGFPEGPYCKSLNLQDYYCRMC
jgi:hypothetical protein